MPDFKSKLDHQDSDVSAHANFKFSRVVLGKIVLLSLCLGSIILLGRWYRAVPKVRSGSNVVVHLVQKEQLRFFAVGDTGMGNANQLKVAEAMEARCLKMGGIDGLLLLGDNFYYAGVKQVDDPQWKLKLEDPYGSDCLRGAPIYPVLGNHDYKGNAEAQIQYSQKNPRWKLPYRFYRVNFGDIMRLVAFDSGFPDYCFLPEICAVDFLQKQLEEREQAWRVVVAHHPLSSSSVKGYGHSGGIFGFLMKPLVCGKADVWLSGHSHHLEHRRDRGCDTDLIISGGGGADLYQVKEEVLQRPPNSVHSIVGGVSEAASGVINESGSDDREVSFAKSTFGFAEILVSKKNLDIKFIDQHSEIIYQSRKTR